MLKDGRTVSPASGLESGATAPFFMSASPLEFALELTPRARVDVIDVRGEVSSRYGDGLSAYPRALCCSFHTTAGYLDRSVAARLNQGPTASCPTSTSSGRCFPRAPATSTTRSSGGRSCPPRSGRSSR